MFNEHVNKATWKMFGHMKKEEILFFKEKPQIIMLTVEVRVVCGKKVPSF